VEIDLGAEITALSLTCLGWKSREILRVIRRTLWCWYDRYANTL